MLFANKIKLHEQLKPWNVHAYAWMHFGGRWDKLGSEGIWGMKHCVLNPVHAEGTHLVQNHGT